ncbi:MAG: phosphoglycerate kinase [Solirubrobacterales bacterium]
MGFDKASVRDAPVKGRRVLVRVDFNVPLKDEGGERVVADDTRIRAAVPTIELLRERGAAPILMSHLGRPEGKRDPALSMAPVAKRLGELLGAKVQLARGVIEGDVDLTCGALGPGDVLLLENVRFEPGETRNDPKLAESLSQLADVFVNDAFGAAHRAHASTTGVADYLPAYAGLLLEREVNELTRVIEDPRRPLVVVLGGAKVSDKVGVIDRFLGVADRILIGGAMCFGFFKAQGIATGNSLAEGEDEAKEALERAAQSDCELRLPVDLVLGREFANDTERQESDGVEVPEGWMGLDIGPRSAENYAQAVKEAGTVLWNGPMGAFEMAPFAAGTRAIAEAVAAAPGTTMVGGGDSVAALNQFGLEDEVDWVSTGGGASLELLEGRKLPGVEALLDAEEETADA